LVCFFFFHILRLLTTVYRFYSCYTRMGRVRKPAMVKSGPDDAFCVVWAIGMFFLNYFVFYDY
jgi:uncharacterized membrane protein YwaF